VGIGRMGLGWGIKNNIIMKIKTLTPASDYILFRKNLNDISLKIGCERPYPEADILIDNILKRSLKKLI